MVELVMIVASGNNSGSGNARTYLYSIKDVTVLASNQLWCGRRRDVNQPNVLTRQVFCETCAT